MFRQSYSEQEFEELIANNTARRGWNFSRMNTERQPVPWEYLDVATLYLQHDDFVLDIGTGGGENFMKLARHFKQGIGVDIDPEMVKVAQENAKEVQNLSFYQDSQKLTTIQDVFDVIINRHAPFDLQAVRRHLQPKGYFVTQQVGEKNMLNIKQQLHQDTTTPTITADEVRGAGFRLLAFMEYDVEYVVKDVESLVFWLRALDMLHADLSGDKTLKNAEVFNNILKGNVDARGFVTNEHRYLVVAQG